ncbi:hypothetical protein ACJJTC_018636 [Scirpophaga incertulas]
MRQYPAAGDVDKSGCSGPHFAVNTQSAICLRTLDNTGHRYTDRQRPVAVLLACTPRGGRRGTDSAARTRPNFVSVLLDYRAPFESNRCHDSGAVVCHLCSRAGFVLASRRGKGKYCHACRGFLSYVRHGFFFRAHEKCEESEIFYCPACDDREGLLLLNEYCAPSAYMTQDRYMNFT